jgi:hypothetical protein
VNAKSVRRLAESAAGCAVGAFAPLVVLIFRANSFGSLVTRGDLELLLFLLILALIGGVIHHLLWGRRQSGGRRMAGAIAIGLALDCLILSWFFYNVWRWPSPGPYRGAAWEDGESMGGSSYAARSRVFLTREDPAILERHYSREARWYCRDDLVFADGDSYSGEDCRVAECTSRRLFYEQWFSIYIYPAREGVTRVELVDHWESP